MASDWVPTEGLVPHLRRVAAKALACGALEPLATDCEIHESDGISWTFFILRGRNRKVENLISQERVAGVGDRPNPFLPYDPRMEVARVSSTHVCLLNKFPVIQDHLLLVTSTYESQDRELSLEDFTASWQLLEAAGGLVFYNGGKAAGASQHHKHLQWLPLPLNGGMDSVPLAPLLALNGPTWQLRSSPEIPFAHVLAEFSQEQASIPQLLFFNYLAGLRRLALGGGNGDPGPYNLLLTRDFMLIVPRAREFHQGVSINSMGYAGSMFVRDRDQLARVLTMKPLNFLQVVGFPR